MAKFTVLLALKLTALRGRNTALNVWKASTMANETSLIGLDELLGKLESVTSDVKLKGGRFALRKAANLIAIKAKENAKRLDDPTSSEEIAENIAVRWSGKRFKTTGDLAFRVGVMGGARQYKAQCQKAQSGEGLSHARRLR